jgi:hypothetical protein
MGKNIYALFIVYLLSFGLANAQFNSFLDPAVAYNKILLDKGYRGTYQNIGAFKVTGSPYIYGETMKGDVYHNGKVAKDVVYKINNYSKSLQIATDVPGQYFMVSIDDLDSLVLPAAKNEFLNANLTFISSKTLDSKKNCFLEQLQRGNRYTLFKSYTTELAIPADNYIQSDLREFKLEVEYFYADNQMPGTLSSLKTNKKALIKTFKESNAAEILDNMSLTGNMDLALAKFFNFLK